MIWNRYAAVLFDLDGVITPTADVHMQAWSAMFNAYLEGLDAQPPYLPDDYFRFVDGKPRFDGVRDFLAARGISLPEGVPLDPVDAETICGLGNRKNQAFNEIVARDGVAGYPGSVRLIEQLAADGVKLAVVSSSKNAPQVLRAARLDQYFPVVVDGNVAAVEGLPGKPAPDTFLRAAELLRTIPADTVVIEDALSGVAAGAAGGFASVVGVDRGVGAEALLAAGADLVVGDLEELVNQ